MMYSPQITKQIISPSKCDLVETGYNNPLDGLHS